MERPLNVETQSPPSRPNIMSKEMQMKTKWAIITLMASMTFAGCGDDKVVGADDDDSLEIVQDGAFFNHTRTVGQEVNCYFGNPKWSTLKGEDGNRYVNLKGIIAVGGVNTESAVQFRVDKDARSFEINAFEIDEVPQGQEIILELVADLAGACG